MSTMYEAVASALKVLAEGRNPFSDEEIRWLADRVRALAQTSDFDCERMMQLAELIESFTDQSPTVH